MEKVNGVMVIHPTYWYEAVLRNRYARKHETVEAEAERGVTRLKQWQNSIYVLQMQQIQ